MESWYCVKGALRKGRCLLSGWESLGQTVPQLWNSAPGPAETAGVALAKRKSERKEVPADHIHLPKVQQPAGGQDQPWTWPVPALLSTSVMTNLWSMEPYTEHRLVYLGFVVCVFIVPVCLGVCLFHETKTQLVRTIPFSWPSTLLPSGTCRLRLIDGFSRRSRGALSTHGEPCGHSSPAQIPQAALSPTGYDKDV